MERTETRTEDEIDCAKILLLLEQGGYAELSEGAELLVRLRAEDERLRVKRERLRAEKERLRSKNANIRRDARRNRAEAIAHANVVAHAEFIAHVEAIAPAEAIAYAETVAREKSGNGMKWERAGDPGPVPVAEGVGAVEKKAKRRKEEEEEDIDPKDDVDARGTQAGGCHQGGEDSQVEEILLASYECWGFGVVGLLGWIRVGS
ncbi:hypothetical protein MMC22_001628 [Lobaria immixta]|nr:hypothetical protein [Lobaria immixta]